MSGWPETEEEMAGLVVAWLKAEGWDVYQEVALGSVADIVAKRGPVLWVIETKRSMTFAVIGQADHWKRYAHLVSVAVPHAKKSDGRYMAHKVCQQWGIGVLDVYQSGRVNVAVEPRFRRQRMAKRLAGVLRPEQQTYAAAGNARGLRWSQWKDTCDKMRRAVEARPGVTLGEVLKGITHHYASASSARSSMKQWLELGRVEGIRMEPDGRKIRLYPKETHGEESKQAG